MPRECWVAEDRRRLPTEDATKKRFGGSDSEVGDISNDLEIGAMAVEKEGIGSGM
jgi:hypothetical protein